MARNEGYTYTATVDVDGPVVAWLAGAFPHTDAAGWAARLADGEVTRGTQALSAADHVRRGDVVAWRRPPWDEPDVPLDFGVLHVDDALVVVDKPAGLPTMPAGGFLEHTLLARVRATWPDASPMHRLGRGTSGVVLFARTAAARSALQAAWRGHAVAKRYRARVVGAPPLGVIDAPLGPVPHARLSEVWAVNAEGRPSRSEVVRVVPVGADSLVDVDITTGRPHQIRAHLAAIGHPLVGDPLYAAGGAPRDDALPGDLGYALHAWRLGFDWAGRRWTFEAPLPAGLVDP